MPIVTTPVPTADLNARAREAQPGVDGSVRALIAAGIDVPSEVSDALDHLAATLHQLNESQSPDDARANLAHRIATGHKPTAKDYEAVTLTSETRTTLILASTTAYNLAREALRDNRDAIVNATARDLAQPAFDALTDLAQRTTAQDTAESLLRARRDGDAHSFANAPKHLHAIRCAVAVRQFVHMNSSRDVKVFGPAGLWRFQAHATRDAQRALPTDGSPIVDWLEALRAGHTPWFPTAAEAEQYVQDATAQVDAHQAAAEATARRKRLPSLLPSN